MAAFGSSLSVRSRVQLPDRSTVWAGFGSYLPTLPHPARATEATTSSVISRVPTIDIHSTFPKLSPQRMGPAATISELDSLPRPRHPPQAHHRAQQQHIDDQRSP